jgi:hypothetical protein
MKNLQYIKLFEAFDSNILTKTLGYLKDKNDRQNFLSTIKSVCNQINYPSSKLSDEYFEYLPFKKAIEKAAMTGDEPCDATSRMAFPQYAVEGEKCEGGKIKRQWGARTREVVCPICDGSGVKPKKSDLKLLKFWFDKDGKSQGITAVDGVIRSTAVSGNKFSKKMSDYNIVKNLTYDNASELKTGDIIKANIQGNSVICYIYKENNRVYGLQSVASGSTPHGTEWRKIARFGWHMGRAEFRDAVLLKQKVKEDKTEIDPYEWNVGLYPRRNYTGLQIDTDHDVRYQIKDSHFAIILDFGKIKKSEYKTTDEIRGDRMDSKLGSKLDPDQSDDSIRKKNIQRYIETLSKNLDISSDITNCDKLLARSLGYKNALYLISSGNIISDISSLISNYLYVLKAESDSDKQYYLEQLTSRTNNLFKNGLKKSSEVAKSIKLLKDKLESDTSLEQPVEKYIQLLDALDDLSLTIYKKIGENHIECIEDFEIVNQKISSIKNIISSERYQLSGVVSYFIENIIRNGYNRTYSYFTDSYYIKIDKALEGISSVKKIVERM